MKNAVVFQTPGGGHVAVNPRQVVFVGVQNESGRQVLGQSVIQTMIGPVAQAQIVVKGGVHTVAEALNGGPQQTNGKLL